MILLAVLMVSAAFIQAAPRPGLFGELLADIVVGEEVREGYYGGYGGYGGYDYGGYGGYPGSFGGYYGGYPGGYGGYGGYPGGYEYGGW